MATKTFSHSLSGSSSGSLSTNRYVLLSVADFNNAFAAAVNSGCKITQCTLKYTFKRETEYSSSSSGEHSLYQGYSADSLGDKLGNSPYSDVNNVSQTNTIDVTARINSATGAFDTSKPYFIVHSAYYYTFTQTVTVTITVTWTYEEPLTVTFKNYDGTVIDTQTVEYGGTATAPSNPTRAYDENYHYTFAGWDKSFSNITADTTVTATYTAVAHSYSASLTAEGRRKHTCSCGHSYTERAYDIGFDNLFSFADWAESSCAKGSGSGSGTVTYNITDGTITFSGSGDFYTAYGGNYYCVPVTAGEEYIFRYDSVSSGGKQAFVFFYDDSGNGITGAIYNGAVQSNPHIGKYDGSHIVFTVPSGCTKIGIRVGITGTAEATYSNIAIYKTSSGDIVNRQYRKAFFSGEALGELYTPIRYGYIFGGWFTGENGTGTQIAASSVLSKSTVLYAKWTKRDFDIGYENIFSLADWAVSTKGTMSNGTLDIDTTAGTITITHDGSTSGTDNNTSQSAADGWYKVPVKGNTSYTLAWKTATTDRSQIHVFFATDNAWTDQTNSWFVNSGDLPYTTASGSHAVTFTTPANTNCLVFRFGTCTSGGTQTFSDICLYETDDYETDANYPVRTAFDYGDVITLTVPVRDGYEFLGWYTADGVQIVTTSSLTESTVVYAMWAKLPPEYTAVAMTYLGKQISETNKVPCGEGFIISVGVK